MKIGIAMTFADGVSGGRLHAYLLGIELAAQGHEVSFVCNRPPGFLALLPDLPGSRAVRFTQLKFDALRPPAPLTFDLWIVVQERSLFGRFFSPVFENARRQGTPLLLLTFETPNWQAALLPGFKHGMLDALVSEASRLGAQSLSMTAEGRRWAQAYFPSVPAHDFHVLQPRVLAGLHPGEARHEDRTILAFVREASAHKGYDTVRRVLNRRLRGWTVVLVGGASSSYEAASFVRHKRDDEGLDVVLRSSVGEEEKYRLIKSARLMLFPSLFEGFGLPPGEAAYWGTPVVAYDLPVLREVYGDSLRLVPAGSVEAFEDEMHRALSETPDFTPSREARRVGDPDRWSSDVASMVDAVMSRARPPLPLPSRGTSAARSVAIVEQAGGWYKDDTAAAAGRRAAECRVITFERDLWAQERSNRQQRFVPAGHLLPNPGLESEDLRGRLHAALSGSSEPLVLLAEDLTVCPSEVVDAACEALLASDADAIAIPERIHFQEHGIRHYRTEAGELLASCGVFRRERLLACLRDTTEPGCRTQPVIDASYLLLSRGGRIDAIEHAADWLPPPSAPVDAHIAPGGDGTWQAEYSRLRGVDDSVAPLPCASSSDPDEPLRMARFRRELGRVLVEFEDRIIRVDTMRSMLATLVEHDPLWAAHCDIGRPYDTTGLMADAYFRFGRYFLSRRHLSLYLAAMLAALAPEPWPAWQGTAQRATADNLRHIREDFRFV